MSTPNFKQILQHLRADQSLQNSLLQGLSNLTKTDLAEFQAVWSTIKPARQQRITKRLVEITEQDFAVNFDSLFIWHLKDPNLEVQVTALEGLWENESPALIPKMIDLLKKGQTIQIRATAAQSLGKYIYLGELDRLDQTRVTQIEQALLETIYKAGEDTEVVRRAIESIAYLEKEGVAEIIQAAYEDEHELMQGSALFAMGRSCDRRWSQTILSALDRDEPTIRFEAARASGELVLSDAVPKLIDLIEIEEDIEIQQSAIWALGQIGTKVARETLERLHDHPNEALHWTAEEALNELLLLEGDLDGVLDYQINENEEDEDEDEMDIFNSDYNVLKI